MSRGVAFEIDFQNSKHAVDETNEDWHSYCAGVEGPWEVAPCYGLFFDPKGYGLSDCSVGWRSGKCVDFGPIVEVIYRGIWGPGRRWLRENSLCAQTDVPSFELVNLRGDSAYTMAAPYLFRLGTIEIVSGLKDELLDDWTDLFVKDPRLTVGLCRLLYEPNRPTLLVGEHVELPRMDEVGAWARRLKVNVD